jgi:hypothetical protein
MTIGLRALSGAIGRNAAAAFHRVSLLRCYFLNLLWAGRSWAGSWLGYDLGAHEGCRAIRATRPAPGICSCDFLLPRHSLSAGTSIAVIAAALGDFLSTVDKHYASLDSYRLRHRRGCGN